LNDNDGHALVLKNAVCLHEEDHGISWKHMDWRTGKTEVRRSGRLVISMIATVGNYEYGYFWYLYQDGTIEYEVKLTGVISTGAVAPRAEAGARHPGRPPALRPQPPAHLLRAAGHDGRRPGQHRLRVRLGGPAARPRGRVRPRPGAAAAP